MTAGVSSSLYAANCTPCKRRKSRCDRVKPCANCKLHACEADCYPREDAAALGSIGRHQTAPLTERGTQVTRQRSRSPPRRGELPSMNSPRPSSSRLRFQQSPQIVPRVSTSSNGRHSHVSSPAARRVSTMTSNAEPDPLRAAMSLALPAPALTFALIDFASADVLGEASFLNTAVLRQTASCIMADEPVSERQACMLFWVLAVASQSVPWGHRLASTYIDLTKSARHWQSLAVRLEQASTSSPTGTEAEDDMLLDVCIPAMQAMWHSRYGEMGHCWTLTGTAIRRAASLRLFDTSSSSSSNDGSVDNLTDKRTRGFLVAHRLLLMDRWLCFNNLCPLGVARDDLDVPNGPFAVRMLQTPEGTVQRSSAEEHSLRVCLEQKQVLFLERGRQIRRRMQYTDVSTERGQVRDDAEALFWEIAFHRRQGEEQFWAKHDPSARRAGEMLDDTAMPPPLEVVFELAEWRSACAYIACVSCQNFIHDPHASLTLRQASMHSACELLQVASVFTEALRSGTLSIPLTRLSNQLFSAFRAIFATRINEDLLGSERATLLGDDGNHARPAAVTRQSDQLGPSIATITNSHAYEHPDLPTLIQDGIECLEEMQKQESAVATRVLNLIAEAMQRHRSLDWDSIQLEHNSIHHISRERSQPIAERQSNGLLEGSNPTSALDRLMEAFLGNGPSVDHYAQLEQMDSILASFLQHGCA